MKVAPLKANKSSSGKGNAMMTPPIPLARSEDANKGAEDTLKFKLLSNPSQKTSPTYEQQVHLFRTGTPEEYIKAVIAIDKVCKGQGINNDAKLTYTMARRIFTGEALTAFNNAANDVYSAEDMSDKGEENLTNYEKVILKVAAAVFPIRAYVTQKQAMRRFMRKPKEMKIRDYVDRLLEINGYLKYFPTNTGERATVLPDDEIMDILTYGIPNAWQKRMVELNFDTQAHTPNEFIEICERISYGESTNNDDSKMKTNHESKNSTGEKRNTNVNTKGNKYCPFHNTNGHDAKECKVILAQCKKMVAERESTNNFSSGNKRQKTEFQKSQKEQMFSFMVNAFKAANKQETENKSSNKKRKANDNYAFDDDIFDEFDINDDEEVSKNNKDNSDSDE